MADIVAFLNARLDEEQAACEAIANVDGHGQHDYGDDVEGIPDLMWEHIERHNPTRTLADIAAKREIIDIAIGVYETISIEYENGNKWGEGRVQRRNPGYLTLLALASPFADHPDFQDEWREALTRG